MTNSGWQGCFCVIGNWVNTLQDIFDTRASIELCYQGSRLCGYKLQWLCTVRVLFVLYNLESPGVKMTEDVRSPSFLRQLFVCGTIFTLSMSIGAGAGFSGVVIPQVNVHRRHMWSEPFLTWMICLEAKLMRPHKAHMCYTFTFKNNSCCALISGIT